MCKIAEKVLAAHCPEFPVIINSQEMTCFISLFILLLINCIKTDISIVDSEKTGAFLSFNCLTIT